MKTMSITMTDKTSGTKCKWVIRRAPRFVQCIGSQTRIGSGWEFQDHDGYVRTASGNWNDLVSLFLVTAENYGFDCRIS